jgi:3-oxoacyl-[acyl-carrier protein] reductase
MSHDTKVNVIETWRLKEEFTDRALELMQEMDDIVGPPAHVDPGWCEHGRFYQLHTKPSEIWMMYTWRSRAEHEVFIRREELLLGDFYAKYCEGPRDITYFTELPVDVEATMEGHGSGGGHA